MKNSQNTVWVAGAGVVAVLLVLVTYFLVVAPQRGEVVDLADQQLSIAQTNETLRQQTEVLAAQFQTLDQKRAEVAAVRSTLPSEAEVPEVLRHVESYAAATGVRLSQVVPGAPEAFAEPGTTTTATTPDTSTAGVVAIPLTLVATGSFAQVELYLKSLQVDMTRHLLVEGVTVSSEESATSSGDVSATITSSIFVLQDGSEATSTTTTGVPDAVGATTTSPSTAAPSTTTAGTVS